MKATKIIGAVALAISASGGAFAHEGDAPRGVPELDHVFVVMMENHSFAQIMGNPNEAYLNSLITSGRVSYAKNYYGIGHPSLTNYLETVGGSNFGVRSDHDPDWHNGACVTNLHTGIPNADNSANAAPYKIDPGKVCPIAGTGTDAATESIDSWNEVVGGYLANIDGVKSLPAKANIDGKTIADQLMHHGKSWKSYQESLPFAGADNVTYSNGTVTNTSAALAGLPNIGNLPGTLVNPPDAQPYGIPSGYLKLYAAKHNPFVYFKSVQEDPQALDNVVPFDGANGLYADLARGTVPDFSFIAPNQCNDQHGRGNGDSFCSYDNANNGTPIGLNPGLIAQGDATIQRIVESIKASPAWAEGRNAIVVVWDENDYSGVSALNANGSYPASIVINNTTFPAPTNSVLVTVETNYRVSPNVASNRYYNHFSLLKTVEAALGLPCLNHACDKDVNVMSDLFAR